MARERCVKLPQTCLLVGYFNPNTVPFVYPKWPGTATHYILRVKRRLCSGVSVFSTVLYQTRGRLHIGRRLNEDIEQIEAGRRTSEDTRVVVVAIAVVVSNTVVLANVTYWKVRLLGR